MAVVRRGAAAVDIGPASAGAVSGLDAAGRLSALNVRGGPDLRDNSDVALGAGPIERRQATAAELARLSGDGNEAIAARRPTELPMHVLRPAAAAMAESHQRGNERMLATKAASRPAQGTEAGTGSPAAVGTPARTEAPPVDQLERPPLPCADCLHEPVCALKGELAAYMHAGAEQREVLTEIRPGLRLFDAMRLVRVECDHHLAAVPASGAPASPMRQPGRHRHAGEVAEKEARYARVVAALERHGGDRAAAARELVMRPNALAMVLKHGDRRGAAGATP